MALFLYPKGGEPDGKEGRLKSKGLGAGRLAADRLRYYQGGEALRGAEERAVFFSFRTNFSGYFLPLSEVLEWR